MMKCSKKFFAMVFTGIVRLSRVSIVFGNHDATVFF
jgi:hypothetical protein